MRSHPTKAAGFTLQGTSRRPHLPPRLLSTSRHSHHLHGRQISTFCILVCGIPLTLPWASNHRQSASTSVSLLQSSRLALKHPTMCFSLQVFLLANVTSNNKLRSAGFGRRYVNYIPTPTFLLETFNNVLHFVHPFNCLPTASQWLPNCLPTASQLPPSFYGTSVMLINKKKDILFFNLYHS